MLHMVMKKTSKHKSKEIKLCASLEEARQYIADRPAEKKLYAQLLSTQDVAQFLTPRDRGKRSAPIHIYAFNEPEAA